jgi:hypothetical protein
MNRPEIEPDPVVTAALRSVPVPAHGPEFWVRLDEALDEAVVDGPALDHMSVGGGRPGHPLPARPGRRPWRPALVAAAALMVLVATAIAVRAGRSPVVAGNPGSVPGSVPAPVPTSTLPPAFAPDTGLLVTRAVENFLTAAATRAPARLGPRSVAYLDALADPAGPAGPMLRDWGLWAGAANRRIDVVAFPIKGGRDENGVQIPDGFAPDVVFAVVRGRRITSTRPQEDVPSVLPVWRSPTGEWLVEPWAIDPVVRDAVRAGPTPAELPAVPLPDGTIALPEAAYERPGERRSRWIVHAPQVAGDFYVTMDGAPYGGGGSPVPNREIVGPGPGDHEALALFVSKDRTVLSGLALGIVGDARR